MTRGDVDLGPCLKPILKAGIEEIVIRKGHEGVFERYDGARKPPGRVFYTQDDDCIVDVSAVLQEYEPGKVVCNMPLDRRPEYRDGIALVGWGCTFTFEHVSKAFCGWVIDPLLRREADRWFTAMNEVKLIDVPFEHLPWAFGEDRMGRERRHSEDLREIRKRIWQVRQLRAA